MKKNCIIVLLFILSFSMAYSEEGDFAINNDEPVKQATLESYQNLLYNKSQKSRKEIIREKLLEHVLSQKNAEIHDYSYRYEKKSIQKRALSCEISVASDILARHTDKRVTEDYLLKQIEKSSYNQLPKKVDGRLMWGDPNAGFVGNIDRLKNGVKASQWHMTGYGVLERPIAKLYEGFDLQTKIITEKSHRPSFNENNHLTLLIENLEKGNSVQLWGDYCTTPEYEDTEKKNRCASLNHDRTLSWYYKDTDGEIIHHEGLAGEHAFFLLGYTGSKYNPKEVIVWDSRTGKHTYAKNEWMRKWEMMQYRSLIIYENEQ